ncbi:MAG: flagellar biosynthetic protein FlhB, partial [Gammaproteobacteria bacterium]|nr:flagellar biosynthetic protein FlhB [Gammaproteobacteria bacterium]
MAENENGQEKTEEASAKRQQEARDKGQIARSRELNTFLMLLASGVGLLFLGGTLVGDLRLILHERFTIDRADMFDAMSMPILFMESIHAGLSAVIPIFVLLAVVATFAPMTLGGWSFSLTPLTPDLKKLDPIKGLGRLLSLKGLMELFKALGKFLIVSAMGIWLL